MSPIKPYRNSNRHEREVHNAFYGGFCCALSAGFSGEDGDATYYVEAVRSVNERELVNYARRTDDIELPKILKAVKAIEARARRWEREHNAS